MIRSRRPDPDALAKRLARDLSPTRFAHALSAARWAAALAPAMGVTPERAYLSLLLHDSARDLPLARLRRLLSSYRGRALDARVRSAPGLWHGPAGAVVARRRYGITDPGVLHAIAIHTVGSPDMSALARLAYLADFAEPRRVHPGSQRVRALARRDPARAFRSAVQGKLRFLKAKGIAPHPHTLALARELGLRAPAGPIRHSRGRRRP